ncbi:hypothetical protein GGR25_003658 [Kaistia hirudinis]|uniref:Uncharacterized protein n=1 Tax=Kaistia hirudinis TaxID=1293440 RepID=A0A840AQG7_9HYPH|nr:hypothetical protein [Kaistia hirudinis]MBB3932600.1 hypothetical protein [Kaistia hirudinis]
MVYLFEAAPGSAVTFRIVSGGTRKRRYNPHFWFDDEDVVSIEDGDFLRSAIPLFRSVKAILIDWVFSQRPFGFRIEPSTDRKEPIYRWMAHRLGRSLHGQYSMVEEQEAFYFYRSAGS